ncbi:hypothetical protein [Actinoalloteichus hymeniacidonis]|nr:hypothetical protein [Actinoalloteichus hymeniacidonis]MBB5908346.1 hypothetical protein [Actinoalloteichus hymeniacidonis]
MIMVDAVAASGRRASPMPQDEAVDLHSALADRRASVAPGSY